MASGSPREKRSSSSPNAALLTVVPWATCLNEPLTCPVFLKVSEEEIHTVFQEDEDVSVDALNAVHPSPDSSAGQLVSSRRCQNLVHGDYRCFRSMHIDPLICVYAARSRCVSDIGDCCTSPSQRFSEFTDPTQ